MTAEGERLLRLFVAIELPATWLAVLSSLQDQVRRSLAVAGGPAPRLRWTRPEGIHLTLKFLGETPASRLRSLEDALATVVREPPRLNLALGEIGVFGDRRGPRVVWVGVNGDLGPLAQLAAVVDSAVAELGWARERRPFAPHLTLARVPDDVTAEARAAVRDALKGVAVTDATPFEAGAVSLMQSHLGPGGARYERLAGFPAQGERST